MRLKCEVQVARGQSSAKFARGSVGLGKASNGVAIVSVSTVKDKNGAPFKVLNNIENVFTKFMSKGQVTIRLTEPSSHIYIKNADPNELQMFVRVLRAASHKSNSESSEKDENVANKLQVLKKTKNRHLEPVKRKLIIESRKEYPSIEGFPKTLTSLEVTGCVLHRVDTRWNRLSLLNTLTLSNNGLGAIDFEPLDLSQMTGLLFLNLSFNGFQEFPLSFWRGIPVSLRELNLSNNSLSNLPLEIGRLKQLRILDISNNKLTELPRKIGKLKYLVEFKAENNQLSVFPAGLVKHRFNAIDVTGNLREAYEEPEDTIVSSTSEFPSLGEIAAKVIVDKRIPTYRLPPRVRKMLGSFLDCDSCGKCCISATTIESRTFFELRKCTSSVATSLVTTESGRIALGDRICVSGSCCSVRCAQLMNTL